MKRGENILKNKPVELAAGAGHRDCVKALIKHGASKRQEEVVKTLNKFGWF